jgi:hypothetical protein
MAAPRAAASGFLDTQPDGGAGWAAGDRTGSRDIRGRGLVLVDALAQAGEPSRVSGPGRHPRAAPALMSR